MCTLLLILLKRNVLGNVRNIKRLIADTFQIRNHFQGRRNHTQIGRHRLLHQQKPHTEPFNIPFVLVDLHFNAADFFGKVLVVLQQCLNGTGNGIFAECSHLNHFGIQRCQLCFVVFSHYPNLPEI